MLPDLRLKLLHDLRMLLQIYLGILPPLADLIAVIGIPCSALAHQLTVHGKIQNISLFRDPFPEHDVKLRLLKRRGDLILYNLHARPVPNHIPALLKRLGPPDVHADRRIELKGAPACRRLRIPEHNAYFLTKLVDEDHHTVRLTDDRGQLPKCL